jgi:zinc/manganese transport system permease protein
MLHDWLIAPFHDYAFMRRALIAIMAIVVSGAPLGVLLVLRRLSLMAEAMSHAVMPGIAIAFVVGGFSLPLMSLGGFAAGVIVALLAGWVTRATNLREDASFSVFYLSALALGVLLVSLKGSTLDLMHLLFGSVLAIDDAGLWLMVAVSAGTLLLLAIFYRPLLIAVSDPVFFLSEGGSITRYQLFYLLLVTLNLVAGFQALGTLMTVGMMIVPAIAGRFWTRRLDMLLLLAIVIGLLSGLIGLLLSYHLSVASGPAIILTAGLICGLSLLGGRYDSLRARFFPRRHLAH